MNAVPHASALAAVQELLQQQSEESDGTGSRTKRLRADSSTENEAKLSPLPTHVPNVVSSEFHNDVHHRTGFTASLQAHSSVKRKSAPICAEAETSSADSRAASAEHNVYKVAVAVRQGNILATAFHPELSDDLRWHR